MACRFYVSTYQTCKDLHCLPASGGLFEQDSLMIEAFQVIGAELAKWESEQMNKHRSSHEQSKT